MHYSHTACDTSTNTIQFSLVYQVPGGGAHNVLRVRVCAAHMGGFLGPEFSKQGSLFRQIFHKQGWVIQKLAKNSKKMDGFSPKFIIKVGMTANFGN